MRELYIVLDDIKDWKPYYHSDRVMSAQDFLMQKSDEWKGPLNILNLCGNYKYLNLGWYVSLLAEARGNKVLPDTSSILNVSKKRIYTIEFDELGKTVDKLFHKQTAEGHMESGEKSVYRTKFFFGHTNAEALEPLARQIFELFSLPIIEVEFKKGHKWKLEKIKPVSLKSLSEEEEDLFIRFLEKYSNSIWTKPKAKKKSRYDLAILHDPEEALPPSSKRSLSKFIQIGKKMDVKVELITKADFNRLGEYDALFIRETTAVNTHTYRFAKKAEAEGIIVIDDSKSILKCTNKIFLANLLETHKVPHPRTRIITRKGYANDPHILDELGYPFIIKIPDGSFSRGMKKVNNPEELPEILNSYFKQSDLVLAQQYVYTDFDWRIGVLGNKALFACKYYMSKGHWQIYNHGHGRSSYGRATTHAIFETPPKVIKTALKAASLIGDGLYGVDLKETPEGILVIEVNDNPNIDAGCEDLFLGDELYREILRDFISRIENKHRVS